MAIGSRQRIATLDGNISLSVHVNSLTLHQVDTTKCLGLTIDQFLTWRNHLQSVRLKVGCGIRILKRIRPFVASEQLINVYRSILSLKNFSLLNLFMQPNFSSLILTT